MANLAVHKVVSALPGTLTPNAVYAVRVGVGFDLYMSDSTGSVAHKINSGSPPEIYLTQAAYDAITTPDPATRYYILPETSAVTMMTLTGAEAEVYLTQAAYDAITTPDPDTKYYVSQV